MQKVIIYILAMVLAVIFSTTYAADLRTECIKNKCVKAQGNVWMRDSPPSGIFYSKGDKTGMINKDEVVILEDTKKVETIFNSFEWLKVKRFLTGDGKENSNEPSTGWVYNGRIEDTPYFKEKQFLK